MLETYRIKVNNLTVFTQGCILYTDIVKTRKKELEPLFAPLAALKVNNEDDLKAKDALKNILWKRLGI